MRLVLALSSAIEFCEPLQDGPYQFLLSVGTMREGARAGNAIGLAANESSSVTVELDNRGKRAVTIVGCPLRVAAEIFDDDGNLYFAGTVSSVAHGANTTTLEVDA